MKKEKITKKNVDIARLALGAYQSYAEFLQLRKDRRILARELGLALEP